MYQKGITLLLGAAVLLASIFLVHRHSAQAPESLDRSVTHKKARSLNTHTFPDRALPMSDTTLQSEHNELEAGVISSQSGTIASNLVTEAARHSSSGTTKRTPYANGGEKGEKEHAR